MLLQTTASLLWLTGCGSSLATRHETAANLAQEGSLTQRSLTASPFVLWAYTGTSETFKAAMPGKVLTVYIEGDGLTWQSRSVPSANPTPINPVALTLVVAHRQARPADAVAYLARPCQYASFMQNPQCQRRYWTSHQTAEDVIASMSNAVDQLKAEAQAQHIRLVGFSGGGGVVLLLAARRHDVTGVYTVAGNVDHRAFTAHHEITALDESLEPAQVGSVVAQIPQMHLVGENDDVVPPLLARGFISKLPQPHCAKMVIAPGMKHLSKWREIWAKVLSKPLPCQPQ